MINRLLLVAACCLPFLGFANISQATESGPILRFGAIKIATNETSSELRRDGITQPGTSVTVNNNTQPGLSLSYKFNSHWALGLVAAPPFKHDIYAKGLELEVGSAKHLPATMTAQYFFNAHPRIQPYVGIGLNYTVFFGEDEANELKQALNGAENLSFENSFGLALEAGVDIAITDNWLINANVWFIDIDTTGSVDTGLGKVKVDVDVDPWVYMLGVGYHF